MYSAKPYPPSPYPFHAESPSPLFVSPQFPPHSFDVIHSFSFTTFLLPSVIYLQLAAYRSLVSLFPSFLSSFFFFPLLSFPFYERNIPYPARSLPSSCATSSPRESPCFYLFTIATNNGHHTSPWDWRERDRRRLLFGGCGIFGLRQIVSRCFFLLLCFPLLFFLFFFGFSFGKNSLTNRNE